MTSSILNEDLILEYLKPKEINDEALLRLNGAARMLLIDAFDRKVTRDQFIAVIETAGQLAHAVSRRMMMQGVRDFANEHGAVTRLVIEQTIDHLDKQMDAFGKQGAQVVQLLKQCPEDGDRIH